MDVDNGSAESAVDCLPSVELVDADGAVSVTKQADSFNLTSPKSEVLTVAHADFNGSRCCFCDFGSDYQDVCGELKTVSNLSVHRLCLFFASNMMQKEPESVYNFWGFIYEDLAKEHRRGVRLKCLKCGRNRAVTGCSFKSCRKSYHYPCAVTDCAMPIYRDTFPLFCKSHRPKQSLGTLAKKLLVNGYLDCELNKANSCPQLEVESIKKEPLVATADSQEVGKSSNIEGQLHPDSGDTNEPCTSWNLRPRKGLIQDGTSMNFCLTINGGTMVTNVNRSAALRSLSSLTVDCPICYTPLHLTNHFETVHGSCCPRAFFHRSCIQTYARTAGYYHFACPFCRDRERFSAELEQYGIEIPLTDAQWEKEPGAFAELLERPSQCDAQVCLNPAGRDSHTAVDPPANAISSEKTAMPPADLQPEISNEQQQQRKTGSFKFAPFELVYCSMCGHHAIHRVCAAEAGWRRALSHEEASWNCDDCVNLKSLASTSPCKSSVRNRQRRSRTFGGSRARAHRRKSTSVNQIETQAQNIRRRSAEPNPSSSGHLHSRRAKKKRLSALAALLMEESREEASAKSSPPASITLEFTERSRSTTSADAKQSKVDCSKKPSVSSCSSKYGSSQMKDVCDQHQSKDAILPFRELQVISSTQITIVRNYL